MSLLLLLLIPPLIFLVTAATRDVFTWTMNRSDEWWAFPLYMATVVPLGFGGLLLVVGLAMSAFYPFMVHPHG